MMDYGFYGLNPAGYHLMNLVFHMASTILLFLIFRRMTQYDLQSALVAMLLLFTHCMLNRLSGLRKERRPKYIFLDANHGAYVIIPNVPD